MPSGWRNLASGYQTKRYQDADGQTHDVRYRFTRVGLHLADHADVALVSATPDHVVLTVEGVDRPFEVARYQDNVFVDSPSGSVHLVALPRFPDPDDALAHGSLVAPMPGSVLRVGAAVGDSVTAGQPLVWLEAMKMEHTISAPARRRPRRTQCRARPAGRGRRDTRPGGQPGPVGHIGGDTHDQWLRRNRGTAGAAQGGGRDDRHLRAGLLPGEGPRRPAHRRIMVRSRETRLHRGEPAAGVRRWRSRHVRIEPGDGGDGRRWLRPC